MADTPPPRLIVVDDDATLAGIVAAIARDAFPSHRSLAVDVAWSVPAAREHVLRAAAAGETRVVVVSDFHLPPGPGNGVDLLQEAARAIPAARLVLMTGEDPDALAPLLLGLRLDAFVEKPFTFERMRDLLVTLVGGPGPGVQVPVKAGRDAAGPASGRAASEGRPVQ